MERGSRSPHPIARDCPPRGPLPCPLPGVPKRGAGTSNRPVTNHWHLRHSHVLRLRSRHPSSASPSPRASPSAGLPANCACGVAALSGSRGPGSRSSTRAPQILDLHRPVVRAEQVERPARPAAMRRYRSSRTVPVAARPARATRRARTRGGCGCRSAPRSTPARAARRGGRAWYASASGAGSRHCRRTSSGCAAGGGFGEEAAGSDASNAGHGCSGIAAEQVDAAQQRGGVLVGGERLGRALSQVVAEPRGRPSRRRRRPPCPRATAGRGTRRVAAVTRAAPSSVTAVRARGGPTRGSGPRATPRRSGWRRGPRPRGWRCARRGGRRAREEELVVPHDRLRHQPHAAAPADHRRRRRVAAAAGRRGRGEQRKAEGVGEVVEGRVVEWWSR